MWTLVKYGLPALGGAALAVWLTTAVVSHRYEHDNLVTHHALDVAQGDIKTLRSGIDARNAIIAEDKRRAEEHAKQAAADNAAALKRAGAYYAQAQHILQTPTGVASDNGDSYLLNALDIVEDSARD